jgi:hypothetical protein
MKKIRLRNLKRKSLIIGLITLALCLALIFIAFTNTSGGVISGRVFAELDSDTFKGLAYVISLIPLTYSIMKFIDYRSLIKLGDKFVITLSYNKIIFPVQTFMKGVHINHLNKNAILFAKSFNTGSHQYEIRLLDYNHDLIGAINYNSFCDSKVGSAGELADQINVWLDNGDKIDPSLF